MAKMKPKKGDRVQVIAGKDKGVVGEILAVVTERGRGTVQGANIVKRHQRDSPGAVGREVKGGIIASGGPIHVSNVQLLVKDGGKDVLTRIGSQRQKVSKRRADGSEYEGTRGVRIARKTGKEI